MAVPPTQPLPSRDVVVEIAQFLAPELARVESILRETINSNSKMIGEIGEYLRLASGKKLRPMLTLLMTRAFGGGERAAPAEIAAAMEAVHVATLLHDDVIDDAALRRGQVSVNARWGNDVAILMADYLYAAAFELALSHLDPKPLRLICEVTRRMCEGEMFQIEQRGQWLSAEDYLYIITCKTAHLFSACTTLGALCGGLSGTELDRATAFGMNFGLAFQITDDALDYTAPEDQLGKPAGLDLASGKLTLPIILALRDATPDDARRIRAILQEGRNGDARHEISALLARYDSIERSLDVARDYGAQALTQLRALPVRDAAAFELIEALPDYVISRRF